MTKPIKTGFAMLFIVGLIIFAISCEDYGSKKIINESDNEKIVEARSYFENEVKNAFPVSAFKNGGRNSFRKNLTKNLVWDKAYIKQLSFGIAVVIPISYDRDISVKKGNSRQSLNELSYALIYADYYGAMHAELVTALPDETYANSTDEYPIFSGGVMVEDWGGNFIKGFLHENGEVTTFTLKKGNLKEKVINEMCWTTDYYDCSSMDGGETWDCFLTDSETTCGSSGGGGDLGDYHPGGGDSAGDPSGDGDTAVKDTIPKELTVPCQTENSVLNNPWFQSLLKGIWSASSANDPRSPLGSRLEDGGWLVDNGDGSISYVPFPETWIRTACGIDPPETWPSDIPDGAYSLIHSHPFYEGENPQSICDGADPVYTSGPSDYDRLFLLDHVRFTGYQGFIGYIIDGSNISVYDRLFSKKNDNHYVRCGY